MSCSRPTSKRTRFPIFLLLLAISAVACFFAVVSPETLKHQTTAAESVIFRANTYGDQLETSLVNAKGLQNPKDSGLREGELTVMLMKAQLERIEKDIERIDEERRLLMMLTITGLALVVSVTFGLFLYTLTVIGLVRTGDSRSGKGVAEGPPKKERDPNTQQKVI